MTVGETNVGIEAHRGAWQGRRRWLIVTGALVVAAVAMGGATILATTGDGDSSDGDSPKEPCTSNTAHAQATTPASPPNDAEVEVTEDGITTTGSMDDNYVILNFGVVLENNASLVAKDVTIEFEVITESGESGINPYGDPLDLETVSVPFIYPGEDFGTGSDALVEPDGIEDGLDLDVTVEVGEWWEVENSVHEFGRLSGEIEGPLKGEDSRMVFSVDSEYCDPVNDAVASVLYRNSDGDIIGGYSRQDVIRIADSEPVDIAPVEEYPPGKTDSLVTDNVWYIQNDRETEEQVDLGMSSVHPYQDPTKNDEQ